MHKELYLEEVHNNLDFGDMLNQFRYHQHGYILIEDMVHQHVLQGGIHLLGKGREVIMYV